MLIFRNKRFRGYNTVFLTAFNLRNLVKVLLSVGFILNHIQLSFKMHDLMLPN